MTGENGVENPKELDVAPEVLNTLAEQRKNSPLDDVPDVGGASKDPKPPAAKD
jgi:hypothetical protein